MSILVTEPPIGTIPHGALANRFGLDTGGLALHLPLEARRIGPIGLAILQAMGKDLTVTGGNAVRNDEHTRYAPVWASAHNLRNVAVLDGQRVTAAMAQHLRTLLGSSTEIVAVCESGTARRTVRLLNRDGADAHPLDWDDYVADHPVQTPPAGSRPEHRYAMDHVPPVDFLLFRHTARQANTADVFAAINADYTTAYKAATTVTPDIDAVLAHLDETTWTAISTAPIVVAIKATQAALFHRGWILRARSDQLTGTLCTVRHPRATDHDWRKLRAYIRPERSAATALFLLNVAAPDIPSVTIADIDTALATGALNGEPIPDLARPLLTAELLRRRTEGHPETDPYLTLPPGNPRRHLEFIIDARRDLDLPIDGRTIRTDNATQRTRLLYSLGLDLRSLT